ncbi:MAG TPA: hypothetical protein VFW82_09375 [Dyella sp.]|nr:hypothetical protein [Dyella sp.]
MTVVPDARNRKSVVAGEQTSVTQAKSLTRRREPHVTEMAVFALSRQQVTRRVRFARNAANPL